MTSTIASYVILSPSMFHYTVNHDVCPEGLAVNRSSESYSSTGPRTRFRSSLYKGITIIQCLITFRSVCATLVEPLIRAHRTCQQRPGTSRSASHRQSYTGHDLQRKLLTVDGPIPRCDYTKFAGSAASTAII